VKTVWIILWVLVGLALVCCGGVFFMGRGLFNAVAENNNAADAFSLKVFKEVSAEWDPSVLTSYASPEFKRDVSESQLKNLMKTLSQKLGKGKKAAEFSATNTSSRIENGDSYILISTESTAEFEKGTGKVRMQVIKRDDKWSVLSFYVDSEALKK